MVEKKSTKAKSAPKKRTAKKVEVSQPVSEPRQAEPVQPQINWDVIGFSSAAVTLLGTTIIFLLGWTYETNWYAYFGVGMEQVEISPQQILVDSLPTLYYVLFTFLGGLAYQYFQKKRTNLQGNFLDMSKLESHIIFANIILFLVTLILSIGQILTFQLTLSELPIPTYIFLSSSFFVIFFLILLNPEPRRESLVSSSKLKKIFSSTPISNDIFWKRWRSVPLFFLTFLFSNTLAASVGVSDAQQGRKGVGESLQKVYLVSHQPLSFLADIEHSCDTNSNCIYGPFGFIHENENSFYLTIWKKEKQPGDFVEVFSRMPGVIILSRNDSKGSYTIIPATIIEKHVPERMFFTDVIQFFRNIYQYFENIYQSAVNPK